MTGRWGGRLATSIHRRQHDERVAIISQEEAGHLLAQIDQLSDEEVNALLGQMMQGEHDLISNGHEEGDASADSDIRATTGITPEEAARLLAQLDQLSDEHVESLLSQIVQEEE